MPLVGEGTDCWRPVRAEQTGVDIFKVVDKIPANENWAFAPESRVRCRDRVFADGQVCPVVFAYAVESNPHYPFLKDHEGQVCRIVLADGEEAVVRITHVDAEHEDFICELLSTNLEAKYRGMPKGAVYAVPFANLVSARAEG